MKEYKNAELTIVSIKNNDIITGSDMNVRGDFDSETINMAAPDRFNWDAGY